MAAWVLYDLANTIFALGVVSLYVPAWLDSENLTDSVLAGAQMVAAAIVIFVGPWTGARSDASGRRIPTLIITTLIGVSATALLATGPIPLTIILITIAIIGVNTGSVVYDALLIDVTTEENRGWVSGVGVGVGYVGSFVGLGIGYLAFEVLELGYARTFQLLALGFLVFAIPAFVFITEGPRRDHDGPSLKTVIPRLVRSWRLTTRYRGVTRFLVGRFFYTDAINTLIGGFLTLFVIRELDFTSEQVNLLLAAAIAAAMIGGLLGGFVLRWITPLRLLRIVLVSWVVAIAAGITAGVTGIAALIWGVGVLGGLALGMTWASDRVVMLRISPPKHIGEFYGLYGTVGRFATIFGPLVWAIVVDGIGLSRNWAMAALGLFVLTGLWILRGVDDEPRDWSPEELAVS